MQQVLTLIAAVLLLIPLFMVSAVVFAVVLVIGLVGFAWFWWQTRAVRRELRARMEAQQEQWEMNASADGDASGIIIEGEVIRDPEKRTGGGETPLPPHRN
ncbi:MAG: LapA family protein [Sulfuritalea sp.]|nr:LapA family protein [Sulfuritalea sp.]